MDVHVAGSSGAFMVMNREPWIWRNERVRGEAELRDLRRFDGAFYYGWWRPWNRNGWSDDWQL